MQKKDYTVMTELSENFIHKTAIVEPGVILGKKNYIGPYCIIRAGTKIGNNNRFEAYCSIGTAPEHRDFFNQRGKGVIIGSDCVFREYVTINSGTKVETAIGDRVVMLRNSHIGHDSQVEDFCNLSCNVLIGGHSYLMEGCNFGLAAMCHQHAIIGAYSMIGMGSVVTKDAQIEPGQIYVGQPAKFLKQNHIGLQRGGVTPEELSEFYNQWLFKTI